MQISQHEESALFDAVDGRATLAGSNRMEILLFSLGTGEHFGINVFKVREVSKTPFITRTPNMPAGVEGLISLRGNVIPVEITIYEDRSFDFITKTPPAAVLLKKACKLKSGSAVPNKDKVATISKAEIQKIAELKMPDLNAASLEAAMSMIAGTARSMGITVG